VGAGGAVGAEEALGGGGALDDSHASGASDATAASGPGANTGGAVVIHSPSDRALLAVGEASSSLQTLLPSDAEVRKLRPADAMQ
jgi:hypothetical protein